MDTLIALLRGINVGGRNKLPMAALTAILEELHCHDVRTYIQSGNAVFRSKPQNTSRLARSLGQAIHNRCGFQRHVMVLTLDALNEAIALNPFPEAESEPKSLHVNFLASKPKRPDMASLERLKKENERYRLDGDVFYLHAPDGIGRSKLAAAAERLLKVPLTGRNWRTVGKIKSLADALE
ncbi:MAG: DUF1697 domain-containing protein [Pirellulaceae bacterium]